MAKQKHIIWFTGMSGSGKSTLASELEIFYLQKGYSVYILDGDDVREKDKEKLGFSLEDVMKNNVRIANLCQELIAENYNIILVPVISPYDDVRNIVRSILEPNFHLIFLDADLFSLKKRDTKGLYRAADEGLINDVIGYSETNQYEVPDNAELVIKTGNQSILAESKQELINYIDTCLL